MSAPSVRGDSYVESSRKLRGLTPRKLKRGTDAGTLAGVSLEGARPRLLLSSASFSVIRVDWRDWLEGLTGSAVPSNLMQSVSVYVGQITQNGAGKLAMMQNAENAH